MTPLIYINHFCRTTEIPLVDCEVSLQLKWPKNCILAASTAANQNPGFHINAAKDVLAVTLPAQENIKLLKQLESGFKRIINWNKYLHKTSNQAQNRYLDFLIVTSFQGVSRLFVLSFKNDAGRESRKQYYLPTMEKKIITLWSMEKNYLISQ